MFDATIFQNAKRGTKLKQIRRKYGNQAPYLSSKSIQTIRITARLRFDLAPLNYSLHKRHLSLSPNCSCSATPETREHVLLHCPLYNTARSELCRRINTTTLNIQDVLDSFGRIRLHSSWR